MITDTFSGLKGVILDMDGVLWKDMQPLGNLPAIFNQLNRLGLKVTLATNNSTRTVDQYLDKLASFGVFLESWQIITSSDATGYLLKQKFPEGGEVYVIGEDSLKSVLAKYGFKSADGSSKNVIAVVSGMDRDLTFEKLRQATLLIRRGIPFIGTNPDITFPTPEGLIPGSGAILAALETATHVRPEIAGKPAAPMMTMAIERLAVGPQEVLCIGDRPETDIAGGQLVGCRTALVLSGVTSAQDAEKWLPAPDLIARDLSTLVGLKP